MCGMACGIEPTYNIPLQKQSTAQTISVNKKLKAYTENIKCYVFMEKLKINRIIRILWLWLFLKIDVCRLVCIGPGLKTKLLVSCKGSNLISSVATSGYNPVWSNGDYMLIILAE